jgi:hypothetical protein
LNERQGLVDRIIAVHPTPAPALEPA